MRRGDRIAVLVLVSLCFAVAWFRMQWVGDHVDTIRPERQYSLRMDLHVEGKQYPAEVQAALPMRTERQRVDRETFTAPGFAVQVRKSGPNRTILWQAEQGTGPRDLAYCCTVHSESRRFELAPALPLPAEVPRTVTDDAAVGGGTRDAAAVEALFQRLVPAETRGNSTAIIRATFNYCRRQAMPVQVAGLAGAMGYPSTSQRRYDRGTRLFAALLRCGHIPARRVSGVILKDGGQTQRHTWVEAWVGGYWVPFCPTNNHFAEIPADYLALRYGEKPLFSHSHGATLKHVFHSRATFAPRSLPRPSGWANPVAALQQRGVPASLLLVLLLLPFGACVVVFGRNVIGIEAFGTFLPAILALGFRETGLVWGLVVFGVVLGIGVLVRCGAERLQLLHTPQLGILLTVTVVAILGIVWLGTSMGAAAPTGATLFPLVITAMTIERFVMLSEEEGVGRALQVTLLTLGLTAACYLVLAWPTLQRFVLVFPETLLLTVAFFILVGRWRGMRLLEYVRFRELAWPGRPSHD